MASIDKENYNDKVVKQFTIMTVIWGVVGMLVGVIIAAQLYWPSLNMGLEWLSFGRLRPLTRIKPSSCILLSVRLTVSITSPR